MSNQNFYEPRFVPLTDLDHYMVFGNEYILLAAKQQYTPLNNAVWTNQGICPTCYNKQFDQVVFGKTDHIVIYEYNLIEAFFVTDPRATGHVAIFSKQHYKDMMEIDQTLLQHIFAFAQVAMISLKKHLEAESIYLCTMCDGPNNHFHLQLIPRYAHEERGSKNFVKPRIPYVHNETLTQILKQELKTLFPLK